MNFHQEELRRVAFDLAEGYDQVESLDKGGMGTLYKARKRSLDIPVVIKRVKSRFHGRMDEKKEADILKSLKHKYLPRIYDIVETYDGYVYTIMDFVPGENLKRYVQNHGAVDQKNAYRWVCQLCEVVGYLHQQNPAIIHSDIKPSNIMITPEGDICLIDFNTSLVFRDGLTAIGKTKGYAAPEQYTRPEELAPFAQTPKNVHSETEATMTMNETSTNSTWSLTGGQRASNMQSSVSFTANVTMKAGGYGSVTKRTDVYSIGATMYYALTAKDPPHSLDVVPPLSSYRLEISRAFTSILEKAMQKMPADRFCDALEMGRALKNINQIDEKYRQSKLLTRLFILMEAALFSFGAVMTGMGWRQMQTEKNASYYALLMEQQTLQEQGDFEGAEAILDEAEKMYDTRMDAYVQRTELYYNEGSYQQCIDFVQETSLRKLVGTNGTWATACFYAAESYFELEDYTNAVTWYQKAVEYDPDEVRFYINLAIAQVRAGDTSGAEQTVAGLEQKNPDAVNDPSYRMVKAEMDFQNENYAGTMEEVEALVRQTEDASLLTRAYLLADKAGRKGGAELYSRRIALLEQAVDILPDNRATFREALASAYTDEASADESNRTAWLQKAWEQYTALQQETPLSLSTGLNTALVQQELEKYDDAAATLKDLLERYPEEYRVYMRLSELYITIENSRSNKDYTRAKEAYKTAKQLYEASGEESDEMLRLINTMEQSS